VYTVTGNIAAFSFAINFYLAACYCVKLDDGVVVAAAADAAGTAIIIMFLHSPDTYCPSHIKQCTRLSLLFLYSVAKLLLAGYVATPQSNATYAKVQIVHQVFLQ